MKWRLERKFESELLHATLVSTKCRLGTKRTLRIRTVSRLIRDNELRPFRPKFFFNDLKGN